MLILNKFDDIKKLLSNNNLNNEIKNLMYAHYYMNIGEYQEAFNIYNELFKEDKFFEESVLANYYMSKLLVSANNLYLSQKMFLNSMELSDKYLDRKSRLQEWKGYFNNSVKCNLCAHNNHKLIIERPDGQKIVKCSNCGLSFLEEMPQKVYLNDIYKTGYYKDSELYGYTYDYNSVSRKTIFLPRLNYINSKSKVKNGKMLDIGCANGEFLEYAREYGWQAYGIEISSEGYKSCMNKKIHISNCELKENRYSDNMFECITMWDVIEHLLDPLDELKEIYRILNKNGRLFISTPNMNKSKIEGENWCGFNGSYEHLFFFDIETLKKMLVKAGFKIEECFSYELFEESFNTKKDYWKSKNAHTLMVSAYKA